MRRTKFRFAESQTTNSLGDLPWWQVFKDPVLQGLIGMAFTNNYDLKQAVARVEQARYQAAAANARVSSRRSVTAATSGAGAMRFTIRPAALNGRHDQFRPTQPERRLGD